MKKTYSYSLLIFITVLWGISFPIMDQTLAYIPPFMEVALRYLISAFLMTILFWKKIIKMDLLHIRSALIIGLPFALGVIGQLAGLKHTSTTNAAFITGLTVIVVPIIMWIAEHDIPTKSTAAGILFSLIGVAFMSFQDQMQINKGDIIVFIGTMGFSVQIYMLGKIGEKLDSLILTILQFYIVGLCALPLSLSFESFHYVLDVKLVVDFIYIIIICTIFALTIQNKVQPYVPASHVSIIFLLEPVSAMIAAFLMGDVIMLSQLIGAIIIMISMVIIMVPHQENWSKSSKGKTRSS